MKVLIELLSCVFPIVFGMGLYVLLDGRGPTAEAQVPNDMPRCQSHKNAHDIVECQLPNGVTCYFLDRVSGTAMSCLEN